MPELPEIANRAREMQEALVGKTIAGIEVLQPKCLNVSKKKFQSALQGAAVLGVESHGKWIFVETTKGYLLVNLGMGGELLLVDREHLPEKYRIIFDFDDDSALAVNFWWFGYTHYVPSGKLESHEMTAKLGPNALDVTRKEFREMLRGRKGRVKSFLLNQERIAGIGNAYAHDILFLAGLHPNRTIDSLTGDEVDALWRGIRKGLRTSLTRGGAFYEKNLYGEPGRFKVKHLLVGYRKGKPCPHCGTAVKEIRTGSTKSYICPACQPAKPGWRRTGAGGNAPRKRAKKAAGRTKRRS
jgi:formamidopyrimidine-DNA glycosylase